jgi:hypothetical protein
VDLYTITYFNFPNVSICLEQMSHTNLSKAISLPEAYHQQNRSLYMSLDLRLHQKADFPADDSYGASGLCRSTPCEGHMCKPRCSARSTLCFEPSCGFPGLHFLITGRSSRICKLVECVLFLLKAYSLLHRLLRSNLAKLLHFVPPRRRLSPDV